MKTASLKSGIVLTLAWLALAASLPAQTLLNLDFGVGTASLKTGVAAVGLGTNDFWNLYRHYEPKFMPGMPMVANGSLEGLKLADGSATAITVAVTNAPGVWGNSSGDPMFDTYIFAQNGSNIIVAIHNLQPGSYYFYLYGHADADVIGEQNSIFTLRVGTNSFGPLSTAGSGAWKTNVAMRELGQYVVFRDIQIPGLQPVIIEAAPTPGGVAVLNGLQIFSRGTSPPKLASAALARVATNMIDPHLTNLFFREIRYDGKVSDTEARFAVTLTAESMVTNEISGPLFDGDVALFPSSLPEGARIIGNGRESRLFLSAPGLYTIKFELVAKIKRVEPWNEISFTGPPVTIASVVAQAETPGVEIQLLNGTQLEKSVASRITGSIGADRLLGLRWQGKAAEIKRKSLLTVDTVARALVKPTGVEYSTTLRYEILQAPVSQLMIELPPAQALTRLQGQQIRDWQVKPEGQRQILTVEFIRPVEKSCELILFSEQTVQFGAAPIPLALPQPLEVERDSGTISVAADEVLVEIESATGLRQVNAPSGALAAYSFTGRPFTLAAKVKRLEPLLKVYDRVTARLEETRMVVLHSLSLTVEKAGLYALELAPQAGFVVSAVRGESIEDWKSEGGKLRVSLSARLLGQRKLEVELEQAHKQFPEKITVLPLVVSGATNVTAQVGAASAPGIRMKTAELSGMREVPISALRDHSDELLAFVSEQPDWKLTLAAEKQTARVLAEVFNLITIGDGLVGGSATIRYGIINQGVQEFRIALPAHWKNIEFTGANIRRKEQQTNVWTVTLQDKAWGGYTLVVTYDYQFDPKGAKVDLAGAHPLEVERETGSLGLMTAASLKLTPAPPADPLRRVDETELSENDRALCTRPLLLAYKYSGSNYAHSVQTTRFEDEKVLEAVADRIELTTVVTEEGQMLTQSSFMVKNNEKQFQKFKLPKGADFWSSYVNGQPAKPERDGEWLLVPLPRDANRDQAFAVDIVYAQKIDLQTSLFPRRIELTAPLTDIPNTYAEWQLFVPVSQRLSGFEGNMTVARGTTYELRDAWNAFLDFYIRFFKEYSSLLMLGMVGALFLVLVVAAIRRGAKGVITATLILAILALLVAMIVPNFVKARQSSQKSATWANLKQIAGAIATYNLYKKSGGVLSASVEEMLREDIRDPGSLLTDVASGQRFVYAGAGKPVDNPDAIMLYSPTDENGRLVLFGDGSVKQLGREDFNLALQRDAAVPRSVFSEISPPRRPQS